MDVGVPELLIILVLVVLLFGVGRIGKIAGELGTGIRAFREGLQSTEPLDKDETAKKPAPVMNAATVEVAKVEPEETERAAVTPTDNHS